MTFVTGSLNAGDGEGDEAVVKRIRVGPHDTTTLSAEGVVSRHNLSATRRLAHFVRCQAIGTILLVYTLEQRGGSHLM